MKQRSFLHFARSARGTTQPRLALLSFLCASSVLLANCSHNIDLDAVKAYATTTAAAATSFDSIADDYYQTCLRQREYAQPASIAGKSLASELPLRPSPAAAPPPGMTPTPLTGAGDDADCVVSSSLAYRWQMENRVVVGYVRALGNVAGVDTAPTNLDSLAAALQKTGAINNDKVATASGNLAQGIANALIAARQRAAVREIAQAAKDQGLGDIVAALQTVASGYEIQLGIERRAVSSYYNVILAEQSRQFAALECPSATALIRSQLNCLAYPVRHAKQTAAQSLRDAAAAAQLRESIRRERSDRATTYAMIDGHIAAAASYADAVDAIGKGNDAILKAPPNNLAAIEQAIQPYVSILQGDVAAMISALKK